MAGGKLDGAGALKMKTLEEALARIQSLHGHVERMAIDVKNQRGAGVIPQQIKRMAGSLQGQLRGQFGAIADLVSGLILVTGRGGSDQLKIRAMREYVAQIRQTIEITSTRVQEHHLLPNEKAAE